jgi:hypothetical protein
MLSADPSFWALALCQTRGGSRTERAGPSWFEREGSEVLPVPIRTCRTVLSPFWFLTNAASLAGTVSDCISPAPTGTSKPVSGLE